MPPARLGTHPQNEGPPESPSGTHFKAASRCEREHAIGRNAKEARSQEIEGQSNLQYHRGRRRRFTADLARANERMRADARALARTFSCDPDRRAIPNDDDTPALDRRLGLPLPVVLPAPAAAPDGHAVLLPARKTAFHANRDRHHGAHPPGVLRWYAHEYARYECSQSAEPTLEH